MDNIKLREVIQGMVNEAQFPENKQFLEIVVPKEKIYELAKNLKSNTELSFDYLFCLSGVDFGKHFTIVYHLESIKYGHTIVLKANLEDRNKPEIHTVSDIWRTAEFHEREIFDLLGITFTNHPDMRKLFLDEDWKGYPLRKDYVDTVNIVER